MIKQSTDCRIMVGQNGVVWVQGTPENEIIAVNTIKKIEQESHVSGLTEKIKSYLEEITGKTLDSNAQSDHNNNGNENDSYEADHNSR